MFEFEVSLLILDGSKEITSSCCALVGCTNEARTEVPLGKV